MDPSDRETSRRADTEATPAMSAMRSRTPADDRDSTEADPAASLAMSTMQSGTPSAYQASTETGREASLVMSTRASGTPANDRDSTEADHAASLGMTVVSKITSAHQASTETDRGASSAISTSEEPRGEPAMVETFTPRVGADASSSKVDATSPAGRSGTPIVWGQGIPLRPPLQLHPPTSVEPRPSTSRTISQASVSDAILRLQQEKTHDELQHRYDQLVK